MCSGSFPTRSCSLEGPNRAISTERCYTQWRSGRHAIQRAGVNDRVRLRPNGVRPSGYRVEISRPGRVGGWRRSKVPGSDIGRLTSSMKRVIDEPGRAGTLGEKPKKRPPASLTDGWMPTEHRVVCYELIGELSPSRVYAAAEN